MERSPAPAIVAQATHMPTPTTGGNAGITASPAPSSVQRDGAASFMADYDMNPQMRTPTRLALGSPMPGAGVGAGTGMSALHSHLQASPAGFNPDDYFASPPCRGRATPECKRRLFLDDPTTPLRNSTPANGVGTTNPAGAGAVTPNGLLFSYGSLETPRAGHSATPGVGTPSGTPSGRKRARPDSTFSLSRYLSPNRSLLNSNPTILLPTPEPLPGAPLPEVSHNAPVRENVSVSVPLPASYSNGAATSAAAAVPTSAAIQGRENVALRSNVHTDKVQHSMSITPGASGSLPHASTTSNAASSALPITSAGAIVSTGASASNLSQAQVQTHGPSTLVTAVAPPRPAKRRLFETPSCADGPRCAQGAFASGNSFAKSRRAIFTTTPITPNDGNARQHKCSCKASKCLKLYCPCFAASGVCGDWCSCQNCMNTSTNRKEIEEARANCLQRDPKAFLRSSRAAAEVGSHSKGCNCRKGCSKNYCICREAGLTCGPRCTCSGPAGCQNGKCEEFPVARSMHSMRNKKRPAATMANTSVPMPPSIPQHPIQTLTRPSNVPLAQSAMMTGHVSASLSHAQQPVQMHSQQSVPNASSQLPAPPVPAPVLAPMAPEPPLLPNGEPVEDTELDDDEQEFFRQLHAVAAGASSPPDEPLFPPTTPERVKKDLLALASTPTTQPSKDKFASRRDVSNSVPQPMSRPPRILRLKMGCGKPIRPFPIG